MRRASSRPERRSHRLASAKAAARVGAALLGGLLLLGSPLLGSSARADAIESLHLSLDAEALRVTIRSSDPLPEPRIRTGRGRVRLWFPGLEHQPRLERRGDAQVLRWVKARPGDEGTGVVILRLADARRIPLDGIQLSRDGTGTVLRIARSLLPGAPPAAEPEGLAGALPEAQGASQPSAGAVGETGLDTLSAGETGLDAPGLQEVSPSEAGEAGSEAAPEAPEAAAAAGDAEATEEADALEDPREAASPEPVSTRPDVERAAGSAPLAAGLNVPDSSLPMGTMIMITLVLGLVYGGTRLLSKRRGTAERPPIHVVATHRLGPRHQLLVVRALGEDHLLSVNAGQTNRLASVPSGAGGLSMEASASALDEVQAPGTSFEPYAPRGAAPTEPPPRAPGEHGPFGAQLLRIAQQNEEPRARPSSRPERRSPRGVRTSPAITGLLRMKREAGLE